MRACPIPAREAARLLYRKAYRRLEGRTPIPADCGALCQKRCCKGGEEEGMILFPYEKKTLAPATFLSINQKRMGNRTVDFAVCEGRCDRALRPLSCRMYPFAPRLENGGVHMRPDPRAAYICPLLQRQAKPFIDLHFLSEAARAVEELRRLPGFDGFLDDYGEMLRAYEMFTGKSE